MRRVLNTLGALVVCVASAAQTDLALAAQQVGETIVVKQQVSGAGAVGDRQLGTQDPVYMQEQISAGLASHGELQLNDNSKIIVGENSSVTLDEFVVGSSGFQSGTIRVLKGAFRMVTGNSPKGAFRIKTPRSTIGIRGTTFDIYVEEDVERFVLFSGELQVCTAGGQCRVANRNCDVIEVSSSAGIEKKPFYRSARSNLGRGDVSLAAGQKRFAKAWRAPVRSCNARAAMEAINGNGYSNQPSQAAEDSQNSDFQPEPEPMPKDDDYSTD